MRLFSDKEKRKTNDELGKKEKKNQRTSKHIDVHHHFLLDACCCHINCLLPLNTILEENRKEKPYLAIMFVLTHKPGVPMPNLKGYRITEIMQELPEHRRSSERAYQDSVIMQDSSKDKNGEMEMNVLHMPQQRCFLLGHQDVIKQAITGQAFHSCPEDFL